MSFVFKLLFVFGVALMVIASDEIVDNQEIEALQKKLCGKGETERGSLSLLSVSLYC